MDSTIIAAVLALLGSIIGTFGGILTTNSLTQYRLKKLEEKVDKHNNLIDRMYQLEEKSSIQEEQIKVVNHRIDYLEKNERG